MKLIKLTIISLLNITIASASQIQLLTEDWSPYQIKTNGVPSGISYDIVKEMQKIVGDTKKIKFYPWNRGYNMTLTKDHYALFSTARTKERENLFKWVGPLTNLNLVFYKLKSNTKIYNTLEDAKNAKAIAVTKNDASEQILSGLGFTNLNVKTGGASQINITKLLKGKVELWPSGYYSGQYRIKQLGVQDKVVITKAPAYLTMPLSIAFSKNTPDEVIVKWQKALDELKSNGIYDKILSKYK